MTFVIAEIGVNHNGSVEEAEELILVAKNAGADAVKFQAYSPVELDPPGARRDMLKRLWFGPYQMRSLSDYCKEHGIEFMATPFSVRWLRELVNMGMKRVKISSSSIDDIELLEAARETNLPVIVSTGMAGPDEIGEIIRIFSGFDLTLLHCVSMYPTPMHEMNLNRLASLRAVWPKVGLSDHSVSIYPAIAAVAMGAIVIEKHLTLDEKQLGPDHGSSLNPSKFELMVQAIRETESAMGKGGLFRYVPAEMLQVEKERDEWRTTYSAMAVTADAYLPSQEQNASPLLTKCRMVPHSSSE